MSELLKSGIVGHHEPGDIEGIYKAWKDIGFLSGLSDEHAKELAQYYEHAAKLMIKFKGMYNNQTEICTSPSVRRIYSMCRAVSEDGLFYNQLKDDKWLQDKLVNMIDVEKLLEKMNKYTIGIMMHAPAFLEHIDSEAELVCLFCNNEVIGMYKSATKD